VRRRADAIRPHRAGPVRSFSTTAANPTATGNDEDAGGLTTEAGAPAVASQTIWMTPMSPRSPPTG
jgi:hypothetical protein